MPHITNPKENNEPIMRKVIGITVVCLMVAICCSGAFAADPAAGKTIYAAKCKACHGAEGEGNPNMAKVLKVDLKPLATTTADIKAVIETGQGKMKPISGLSGAEVDNVVAYVKSLKK